VIWCRWAEHVSSGIPASAVGAVKNDRGVTIPIPIPYHTINATMCVQTQMQDKRKKALEVGWFGR
jgi:hypothetical protein